jgi:hypothetical protein
MVPYHRYKPHLTHFWCLTDAISKLLCRSIITLPEAGCDVKLIMVLKTTYDEYRTTTYDPTAQDWAQQTYGPRR